MIITYTQELSILLCIARNFLGLSLAGLWQLQLAYGRLELPKVTGTACLRLYYFCCRQYD